MPRPENFYAPFLEFLRAVHTQWAVPLSYLFLLLIIVRIVDALHEDLAVINLVGQGTLQQLMDATAVRMAGNHSIKIIPFVYLTPVYAHLQALLEYQVEPYAC